jgi:hypothetical protein
MIARRPTGGDVRGATPAHPLLFPVGHQDVSLSQSPQQQLLDQRQIQRMFADGALGGLWLPEPQYLYEDSAGTIPASLNGVVGAVRDVVFGLTAVQATTANKPYLRRTPVSGKYWLDGNTATAAMTATFPTALSVLYISAMGRRNIFLYSETYTESYWKKGAPGVSVLESPQGEMSASAIYELPGYVSHRMSPIYSSESGWYALNTQYTMSYFVKAGTRDIIRIGWGTGAGSAQQYFNLSTRTATNYKISSTQQVTKNSAGIVDAGDGRVRCSLTFTTGATITTGLNLYIGLADANEVEAYEGDPTKYVYLWGAQLELGASATEYQKITHGNTPCTVARANADGISLDNDANITTTYNLTPPYGYNSAVMVINRPLTASETAVVSRYLRGWTPIYANGVTL